MFAKILIKIIDLYQKYLSLDTGYLGRVINYKTCRMYPTCSEYTKISIERFGAVKGTFLGIKRILRCHPFNKTLIDFPEK